MPVLQVLAMLAGATPFLAILVLLAYFFMRRVIWSARKRLGKPQSGFCPSVYALGTVLQFVTLFYQPQVNFEIKTAQVEFVEEDDQGDPEAPAGSLDRQLKKIRRGESIEGLILRSPPSKTKRK